MELRNETYTVLSNVESKPVLVKCDIVHNLENIDINDHYIARIFEIMRSDGHSLKLALIDLTCSSHAPHAILDGNTLITILFRSIVRIDMDNGRIVQYEECDNMGGLFEIHSIDGGYLIWGEGGLFCYNLSLNRLWHFVGRDILVSSHCNKHFWIEQEEIHCRDFLGWHYVLDYDGKLLCEFYEFNGAETL